jgi:hypothetical protein
MELSLIQIIGIGIAVAFMVLMIVNALVMLVSPTRWFDLPPYVGFHGTLRRSRISTFGGRLEIRALGLILVILLGWMMFGLLKSIFISFPSDTLAARSGFGYLTICLVTCLAASVCGVRMLLTPGWWLDRYVRPGIPESQTASASASWRALEATLRVLGAVILGMALYFAYRCLRIV